MVDTRPVIDWLIAQALAALPIDRLLTGLSAQLEAAGVPVSRIHLSGTVLDPQTESVGFTWKDETGRAEGTEHRHGSMFEPDFQASPFMTLLEQFRPIAEQARRTDQPTAQPISSLRLHLAAGEGVDRYPMAAELLSWGATDYVAFAVGFGFNGRHQQGKDVSGVVTSFTTRRTGGFAPRHLDALMAVQPALATAARMAMFLLTGVSIVKTYLGEDAGRRVLQGEIRRGTVTRLDAAILYADLRGFSALAETTPRAVLVDLLNEYLARMADPVHHHGGQVLKFLGDGMLATFGALAGDEDAACVSAMQAAEDILWSVADFNRRQADDGQPSMAVDIALHLGEVAYGNVGSESRLDFTVIGPAVNQASRMETLCRSLECPLIVSRAFVQASGCAAAFRPLGRRNLRGLNAALELFTLDRPLPE